MNQKGFANIILVVVIVILVGAIGYFALVRKSTPIPKDETAKQPAFCPPAPSCKFFIVFGDPPIFSNGCINYVCPETPVPCGTLPLCPSPLIMKLPDPRPGLPISCLADYATCVLPQ